MQPFRLEPNLPPQAYQTYQILAPKETHWRVATCAEVQCPHHETGWQTVVDESAELGQGQAHYIRTESGRRFTEHHDAGLTTFRFEAGQRCFTRHEIRLEKPEIYLVKPGDWRTSDTPRRHANADDWVDDFANHQQTLADRLARG